MYIACFTFYDAYCSLKFSEIPKNQTFGEKYKLLSSIKFRVDFLQQKFCIFYIKNFVFFTSKILLFLHQLFYRKF